MVMRVLRIATVTFGLHQVHVNGSVVESWQGAGTFLTLIDTAGRSEPPRERPAQWFDSPIQAIAVKPTGPFSGTANGACPVEFGDQESAYVKPRPDALRNLVVAREKIAADLAHMLGFPVAPVVVRTPDPANGSPYYSAMSLAILPSARHWSGGGVQHLAAAGETLEFLRVYWTWIGDSDHNGHGENLLYAVKGGNCMVLAIDHSYSMCHGDGQNSLAVPASQGYGTMVLPGCGTWTAAGLSKILALDWVKVDNVVRRLHAIVSNDEQDRILRILRERRDHLATFLGL
jgi:hypothetical protein